MKIGIIGAGNVGSALAKATVRAGHDVKISSRDASDAQRLASEAGAQAVSSNREAIADAEIVIPAVMLNDIGSIVNELGSALDGKVLIDVSNRFMPDQLGQPSNAEQVQEMAPGARVVKAFNTIFASLQGSPQTNGVQLDGLVAGDDAEAKAKVVELVRSLGFRPIDAGPLAMARALEGMGTLNIQLNHTNGWRWQTGWKLVGPTGQP